MSLACLIPARTAAVRSRYGGLQLHASRDRYVDGRRNLTDEEVAYLRTHGATSTVRQLCEALQRAKPTIAWRLARLGIRPRFERQPTRGPRARAFAAEVAQP